MEVLRSQQSTVNLRQFKRHRTATNQPHLETSSLQPLRVFIQINLEMIARKLAKQNCVYVLNVHFKMPGYYMETSSR